MNPKNEIVAVARGYYALPLINALNRRGLIHKLLNEGVYLSEVEGNERHLAAAFKYLRNLGWVEQREECITATELGRKILRRSGAFGILYSYRHYFGNLEQLLFDRDTKVEVYRDDNVRGSGQAHIKKYFSRVLNLVRDSGTKYLLDVGCGDGTFLSYCKDNLPDLEIIGVDYSEKALAVTRGNMKHSCTLMHGNVSEPLAILDHLQDEGINPNELLVSVWFIFHEVLGFEGINLTEILRGYRKLAPEHGLIIGEIFDIPHEVLAHHHNGTAVPEFNLFHDLSGQMPFTHSAWREHIDASGFTEEAFIGLDELSWDPLPYFGSGIWYLK